MDNNQNNYNNPYGEPTQNNYSNSYSGPTQNNYYQPVQPQATNNGTIPPAARVLSIVSLVTGIVGIVFFYCYGMFIVSSIAALVTGNIANQKANGVYLGKYAGMLKAGKITGIIGIVLNAIFLVIMGIALGAGMAEGIMDSMYY